MSACDVTTEAFPCVPNTFVAWSSLAYIVLPLNIGIYDLEQLYLFNGNVFEYHTHCCNAFQTGIYSYILCLLTLIHSLGSFSCHGCSGSQYFCYIDTVALYCIYCLLSMFSWTRLFCQFKINQYFKTPNTDNYNDHDEDEENKATFSAQLIYSILFSSKYHWILTFISVCIGTIFGIIAIITFGEIAQLATSGTVYSVSYFSFFVCEYLIRKILMIKPLESGAASPSRSLRLSSMDNTQHTLSLGSFQVKTENKRAIFSLIFIIIAGCGYLIDVSNVDETCMNIGHAIYHIFSAIALTFWYWSLIGEKWSFIKHSQRENQVNTEARAISPNSTTYNTNTSEVTDTSLRPHIINSQNTNDNTFSTGQEVTVINSHDDYLYKTSSGRKRSFID